MLLTHIAHWTKALSHPSCLQVLSTQLKLARLWQLVDPCQHLITTLACNDLPVTIAKDLLLELLPAAGSTPSPSTPSCPLHIHQLLLQQLQALLDLLHQGLLPEALETQVQELLGAETLQGVLVDAGQGLELQQRQRQCQERYADQLLDFQQQQQEKQQQQQGQEDEQEEGSAAATGMPADGESKGVVQYGSSASAVPEGLAAAAGGSKRSRDMCQEPSVMVGMNTTAHNPVAAAAAAEEAGTITPSHRQQQRESTHRHRSSSSRSNSSTTPQLYRGQPPRLPGPSPPDSCLY